jgi:hypothetical protein
MNARNKRFSNLGLSHIIDADEPKMAAEHTEAKL